MANDNDILDDIPEEDLVIEDEKRKRFRRILVIVTAVCLILMIIVIPFSFLVEFVPNPNENETTTPISSTVLVFQQPFELKKEETQINNWEITPEVSLILQENTHIVSNLVPRILVG